MHSLAQSPCYVGIDVSAQRLDVHLHPDKECFSLPHTRTGIWKLISRLRAMPHHERSRATMLLTPRIPKAGLPPTRSKPTRSGMSRDYLAFIGSLACPVYPEAGPIEPHHLLRADRSRGMGRRAADQYAIPLSTRAHRELHAAGDEEAWLAEKGIDRRALAAALWRVSGDLEAGLRVAPRARLRGV